MAELRERDAMMCRACGKEERASEGYPCSDCGRFICNMCNMRGVVAVRRLRAASRRHSGEGTDHRRLSRA